MTIERITISVPKEVARRIKKAAAKASVSAWVTGVIEATLNEAELERVWHEFYASVHPSSRDVKRAEAIFERLTRPTRRRKKAA